MPSGSKVNEVNLEPILYTRWLQQMIPHTAPERLPPAFGVAQLLLPGVGLPAAVLEGDAGKDPTRCSSKNR
ncbi:MAG: hypothetical protein IJ604_00025 [Prevotella sp.]|nr:hypothetical protein [Prevotella sp.]